MSEPNGQPDPPLEPMAETTAWYESGPSPILDDLALATLIVRIGMANNALAAQFNAGTDAFHRSGAVKVRDALCSLVTSAALTNEAIKVVSSGMKQLQPFARTGDASTRALEQVSNLCAGTHPATEFLHRARNQVGFHWDEEIVEPSVQAFAKNRKLVWMEADDHHDFVHRLASDVLAHALFPAVLPQQSLEEALRLEMDRVVDAMKIIVEFCTAATFGYLKACGAVMRATRSDDLGKPP